MTSLQDEVAEPRPPITLRTMGSLSFAGRVVAHTSGDTCHGDNGYAQYFVPQDARSNALIFWHGIGQSGRTWESTPDGRDGFWQIFTRRDWPTYIIDQPRRGRAGRSPAEGSHTGEPDEHPTLESEAATWSVYRLGLWQPPADPQLYAGLQFPTDPESISNLMFQQTPNTAPEPFPDAEHRNFMGGAVAQLVDLVGPSVLVSHSHSAQYGWVTAMRKPDLVRAVIALEPGEFAFPADDPPADIPTDSEVLAQFMAPQLVPAEDFAALCRMPILVVMADNISIAPSSDYGVELWRIVRARARQFVDTVNGHGGDASYVELPDVGLKGNTHFMMADLNNVEVADVLSEFLSDKGLEGRERPHLGPRP